MRRILSPLIAVSLLASGALSAQSVPRLNAGDRVRVSFDLGAGRVVVRGDVVILNQADGTVLVRNHDTAELLDLPLASITKLHVSLGHRSTGAGALRGAGIGLLIGGGAGAVVGFASGDDPPGWFSMTAQEKALLLGIGLGGLGAVVGGLVGLAAPGERWQRLAATEGLRIAPEDRGGVTLTYSYRF